MSTSTKTAPETRRFAANPKASPVSSRIIAFTDGACSNNQNASLRAGGWATILILETNGKRDEREGSLKEFCGFLPGATNNQAELEAIRQIFLNLKREGLDVVIYTDSAYAIGVLAEGNKVKANGELVAEIKTLMSKHNVSFGKVKGHDGVELNERCDHLAKQAIIAAQPY
jgi:ribonuclease HI